MTIEVDNHRTVDGTVEFDTPPGRDGFYYHVWLNGNGPNNGGSFYYSGRQKNNWLESLIYKQDLRCPDINSGRYIPVAAGETVELFPGLGIYVKGS